MLIKARTGQSLSQRKPGTYLSWSNNPRNHFLSKGFVFQHTVIILYMIHHTNQKSYKCLQVNVTNYATNYDRLPFQQVGKSRVLLIGIRMILCSTGCSIPISLSMLRQYQRCFIPDLQITWIILDLLRLSWICLYIATGLHLESYFQNFGANTQKLQKNHNFSF